MLLVAHGEEQSDALESFFMPLLPHQSQLILQPKCSKKQLTNMPSFCMVFANHFFGKTPDFQLTRTEKATTRLWFQAWSLLEISNCLPNSILAAAPRLKARKEY
jgi:hypothetical protein